MPKKKVFHVSFYIDLHAVTSPGVWLCPKGKVSVRVTLFGVSEVTKFLPPIFPLLYHERFHFQKVFKKAGCLPELEARLARVPVRLQLFQHPEGTTSTIKLAFFKACLGDLLFPPSGGDFNLMFSPTKRYPGIIAPIAEISTRLSLSESEMDDGTMTMPYTVLSRGNGEPERTKGKGIVRQKAVCHTKQYINCNCFSNRPPKMFTPTNKRKLSGDWVKRDLSPAHMKSHRNFESNFQSRLRQFKSDTSLDTVENRNANRCRPCQELLRYPNQENYIRNVYFEENKNKSHPVGDYKSDEEETSDPTSNYYRTDLEHLDKINKDSAYPQYYNSIKHDNSLRKDNEDQFCSDPCEFNKKDFFQTTKRDDQVIKELKKQLKELLEEEESQQKRPLNHCNTHQRNMICCLCCPKERYNHGLQMDSHRHHNKKDTCHREMTSCYSECFVGASKKSPDASSYSNKSNLEEDIRKRPMFYSNLHAAYEKLCNKRKNKKSPVWR